MALVTMKEMLADARARHYCVAAFDVSNYEMARNVVDVAAEEKSPVILMALKNDLVNGGLAYLSAICKIKKVLCPGGRHKCYIPKCLQKPVPSDRWWAIWAAKFAPSYCKGGCLWLRKFPERIGSPGY